MERGCEGANELAEVRLAGVGDFFKIDDDAGLVRFHGVFNDVPHQILPRRRVRQHLRHFLDAPIHSIVVVHQPHHGQLDGRIERLHPLVQLVVLQQCDAFRRGGFDPSLPALVVHDSQRAVRRHRVQLLGN